MTRDEAIRIVLKVPPTADADTFVDKLAALGILKLDEPKSDLQRLMDRMGTPTHPSHIPGMLEELGLKIISK